MISESYGRTNTPTYGKNCKVFVSIDMSVDRGACLRIRGPSACFKKFFATFFEFCMARASPKNAIVVYSEKSAILKSVSRCGYGGGCLNNDKKLDSA